MNTKELRQWLSRRRESRILDRIREHLILVNSCIMKSKDFFQLWKDKDEEAAKNISEIIHQEEKTADCIEAERVDMLSSGETPEYVRSDLITFIKLADRAAGSVKRGVKNLLLLIKHEFPKGINKILEDFFELLAEEIVALIKVFDAMFKVEHTELIEIISKVDNIESALDEQYVDLKREIAYNTENVPAGALIILDHAIKDLERTSDLIEDCADMLRSIVLL
jgi:predicted phosphate transport protein (TIGR00153 family)